MEDFKSLFLSATRSIKIIGTTALIPYLEQSAQFFADLLVVNENLTLVILCESDSELFSQSLCTDTSASLNRASYAYLEVHRDRILGKWRENEDGLKGEISRCLSDFSRGEILGRITVLQANLRLPVSLLIVDDNIWMTVITHNLPTLESYILVESRTLSCELLSFIDFYLNPDKGGIYLSKPGEELIQLYDLRGYPRGLFPRTCFYNTTYKRYTVWGFIFNRRGQLLLHQRSDYAKDGACLWDKSLGGHVDPRDSSTSVTVQRELVEELFLPGSEFSKYVFADFGDILHWGDWNPQKRPERSFREALRVLAPSDWVMFRATDHEGDPLIVSRISVRRVSQHGIYSARKTLLTSEIYLFIAPSGYLDTDEQMHQLLAPARKSGAASDHKLLTIRELREWISEKEREGQAADTFTDDLLFISVEYRELLEQFSEFVTYSFRNTTDGHERNA